MGRAGQRFFPPRRLLFDFPFDFAFDFDFDFDFDFTFAFDFDLPFFPAVLGGAFFLEAALDDAALRAPALRVAALRAPAFRAPAFFAGDFALLREPPLFLKPGVLTLTAWTAAFAVSIVPDETSVFPWAARFPIIVPAIAPTAAPTGPPRTLPTTAPATPPAVCLETGNCDCDSEGCGCGSLLSFIWAYRVER
jgi:hypothetical protein